MNTKLKLIVVTLICFLAIESSAQKSKLWSIEAILDDTEVADSMKDLEACISDIELAKVHVKTANLGRMWYLRGKTYTMVYQHRVLTDKYPKALDMAYESFVKALELKLDDDEKDQIKKFWILNVAIGKFNQGYNYYTNEKWSDAMTSFDQVYKITELDTENELAGYNITPEKVVKYKYYTAQQQKNYTEAIKLIQSLIDKNFYDPNIYVDLARVHLSQSDTTAALAALAQGKEIFPSVKEIINMELDLYLKMGRSDELIGKLSSAIEEDPDNHIYYFARAISYEGMGKTDEAEKDYKSTIDKDPGFFDAYYNLGVLHYNKANPIIEKRNAEFDPDKIEALDKQLLVHQMAALEQFELGFNTPGVSTEEKMALADVMLELYKRTRQKEKRTAMEAFIQSNK